VWDQPRDPASLIFDVLDKEKEPNTLNILLHTVLVDHRWVHI
jgi:hypothetical protein